MKALEFRKKSKDELRETLSELRTKLDTLRFDSDRKKVKNVKELAGIKRDIARVLTVLNQQL
jgi:ribosomal protein L29